MSPDRSGFDEPTAAMPLAEAETPSAAESTGESMRGWLPSRPASVPAGKPAPTDPLSLGPGGRIGEFIVERVLGKGGFGVVYLARQLSLDRYVALKVVAGEGCAADSEGRSLARLEHDNIVQVYSETFEPVSGSRMLCMQYVAGTTLSTLTRELSKFRPGRWTGPDLLAVLDGLDLPPALFDRRWHEDAPDRTHVQHAHATRGRAHRATPRGRA
jgi:serine/threonine protein kinase